MNFSVFKDALHIWKYDNRNNLKNEVKEMKR